VPKKPLIGKQRATLGAVPVDTYEWLRLRVSASQTGDAMVGTFSLLGGSVTAGPRIGTHAGAERHYYYGSLVPNDETFSLVVV
jgi:hypothetical protein